MVVARAHLLQQSGTRRLGGVGEDRRHGRRRAKGLGLRASRHDGLRPVRWWNGEAGEGDPGPFDAARDVDGAHASTHDRQPVAAVSRYHGFGPPPALVLNDEGDVALVSGVDKAARDQDVARVLGWVGVLYRVRAGLVDGDDDVVEVRFGPRQCFKPLPKAAADDQYGRGFGMDNHVQPRWCGAPSPVSARRSRSVHDAGIPEPSRFMPSGDREAAQADR